MVGLPYLMLGIDLLSKTPNRKRQDEKQENLLNDLDRAISRAKKEYQLEQQKSGTKEQADLNRQIEILTERAKAEQEKNNLLSQTINELKVKHNEELENLKPEVEEIAIPESLEKHIKKSINKGDSLDLSVVDEGNLHDKVYEIQLSGRDVIYFKKEYINIFKEHLELRTGLKLMREIVDGPLNVFDHFGNELIDLYQKKGIIKVVGEEYAEFTVKGKFFINMYYSLMDQ